ncbi:hypothetical protein LSH36_1669g00006 [Paralvinella palmiformis]|uniref:Galactosyltransferase N-terminal domain-containing protein n=1 Tax=Paralvinella palmiformis TaxID=53620 RepID=A0AAD9ISA5_9ANNE|nr:hypothetical protein LSH36_1669g00006 [Paralvinella palmiformis]
MSKPESFDDILPLYNGNRRLEIGGKWRPSNCTSISRLAVVMTYRNRSKSIKLMLQHLHGFLQKQLIRYQMFVIEPPPDTEFNRGLLKNIGFVESGTFVDFQCVVFQDIDLLPGNDRNLYHCPTVPRHLVVGIDTRRYK